MSTQKRVTPVTLPVESGAYAATVEKYFAEGDGVKKKMYAESTIRTASFLKSSVAMAIASVVGDFALTAVLGAVAIGTALFYANLGFITSEGFFDQKLLLLLVIGPIFTVWNIAQYASFAFQTTGHIWPVNHWWAMQEVGPLLLIVNLSSWGMVVLAYEMYNPRIPAALVHVPILAFGILGGIYIKTSRKVRYIFRKFTSSPNSTRFDALIHKAYAMGNDIKDNGVQCPFSNASNKTVMWEARGPILCFLWTAAYTVGLGLLYNISNHAAFQWFLLFLGLAIHLVGFRWLGQLIDNSHGVKMYSKKMILVFCFVYGLVSGSQIRLIITKFTGVQRTVASLLFALLSFLQRMFASRKLKGVFVDLKQLWGQVERRMVETQRLSSGFEASRGENTLEVSKCENTIDQLSQDDAAKLEIVTKFETTGKEANTTPAMPQRKMSAERTSRLSRMSTTRDALGPFLALSRHTDHLCIKIITALVAQNTCTLALAGLTCAFADNSFINIGVCPGGLGSQLLVDLGPLLAFDILEIFILVFAYKVPTVHLFLQFDWFVVVAAVLVVYLDCIVIIWAVSPMFQTASVL